MQHPPHQERQKATTYPLLHQKIYRKKEQILSNRDKDTYRLSQIVELVALVTTIHQQLLLQGTKAGLLLMVAVPIDPTTPDPLVKGKNEINAPAIGKMPPEIFSIRLVPIENTYEMI